MCRHSLPPYNNDMGHFQEPPQDRSVLDLSTTPLTETFNIQRHSEIASYGKREERNISNPTLNLLIRGIKGKLT